MNKHSYELERHSSEQSSDMIFDELFSQFDLDTNDLHHSDSTTDRNCTLQSYCENQTSNTYKSYSEQDQQQTSLNSNLSLSLSDSIPMKYHQLTTINSLNQVHTSNEQTNDSSSSSTSFHPSFTVTYDQLQSLISTSPQTSNVLSNLLQTSTIIGHNIPLKIVSSTSSNQFSTDNQSTSAKKTTNHHRRKPSHNVIEKRYRSSINEKIQELKEIVAASEKKIQKSSILRRTIEYIHQLESINQRLEEENSTLKIILKQLNLTNDNQLQSTSRNSFSTSTDQTNEEKTKKRKQGMGDGSRLTLCCFMLCLLLINPFHYLLNRIHSSSETFEFDHIQTNIYSRTLQSTIDNEYLNLSSKQMIGWMLNIAMCLICLVKIFIDGETILQESDLDNYTFYKKQADQFIHENRFNQADFYYKKSCEQLFIKINQNSISTLISILWQICRFVLNLIYIGRWLTSCSTWMKSIQIYDRNFELNSCLIQIWKIEYQSSKSFLNFINLFLLTLNTAMNSEKNLSSYQQNEIYFLTILTIKTLPRWIILLILCLIRKFFQINLNEFDLNHLTEFLLEKNVQLMNNQSLIESIRIQYFQYIFYENIKSQFLYYEYRSEENYLIRNENNCLNDMFWWQFCFQMIQCISSNNQIHLNENENIYEQIRAKRIVDSRYITIMENLHIILVELNNEDDQINFLFEQLGQTSRLLISMIKIDDENNFDLAIKTLFLDGILALRLRLLTNFLNKTYQQILFLDDFQQELETYKQLNQSMKLPKQRYHLFEAIFRILSGLNPLITEILFESAIKQRHKEFTSNLDVISALLLFCYFSPSTINRYRTVLQQAAMFISTKTNRNSYLDRLQQQCLILMSQSYLTF